MPAHYSLQFIEENMSILKEKEVPFFEAVQKVCTVYLYLPQSLQLIAVDKLWEPQFLHVHIPSGATFDWAES